MRIAPEGFCTSKASESCRGACRYGRSQSHPHARCDGDHRSCPSIKAATAGLQRRRVDRAGDQHPGTAVNSISIVPLPAGPTGRASPLIPRPPSRHEARLMA
jgi:hypothetical protein